MNETPADLSAQIIETTRAEFESFGAHYDSEIKPLLIQKEAERYHRIKLHNAFIGWSWIIVPLVAILWAIFIDQGDSFLGTIFIGLGGGYFLAKLFMYQFRSKVMQHIVGTTARFLDWKHQTDPDNFVIPDAFEDFGLIPDSLTAPKISMAVDGKIQNTDINLYKIKVQRYGRGNEDFAGLIMIMDFHRNFLGNTVILRNEETAFQFGKHDLKPVKLVDSVFEKTFDVFGDDQVEARYLLDPVFMEKLLDLEVLLMQSTKTERRKPHLKKNSTIPEPTSRLSNLRTSSNFSNGSFPSCSGLYGYQNPNIVLYPECYLAIPALHLWTASFYWLFSHQISGNRAQCKCLWLISREHRTLSGSSNSSLILSITLRQSPKGQLKFSWRLSR